MEPLQQRTAANGVGYFVYDGWNSLCGDARGEKLSIGFSSRLGGVSFGNHDEGALNCALHVGDRPEDVIRNRQLLADALEIPLQSWTCAEQVHGHAVQVIGQAQAGAGAFQRESAIASTDGLLSNESGVWLTSFYADCVPLYFFDPIHGVLGVAHAGWRGTVARIAAETIQVMAEQIGSQPEQIRCLIGPAIDACCYEVDGHVIEQVDRILDKHKPYKASGESGLYMLDLKRCNQIIMMEAGILPNHIEISQWCTGCRTDLFFSHRMEQGKTGRMVAWLYRGDDFGAR